MKFFSKRKNENNGFVINGDDDPIKISGDKNLAPHAMTPDEVSALWVLGDDNHAPAQTSALDLLKKRMNVSDTSATPKSEDADIDSSKTVSTNPINTHSGQKAIKTSDELDNEEQHKTTLVEKVKRYTVDDQGKDMAKKQEPLYHLETVAEIIMSDGQTAMRNLSEKYGIDIVTGSSTQTAPKKVDNSKAEEKPVANTKTSTPKPTVAFEKMVADSEKRESQKLYETLFEKDDNLEQTRVIEISLPDISDIDTHETDKSTQQNNTNTATIRFTPVKDNMGNTDHITVSSSTKHIDLNEEYYEDISSKNAIQDFEQTEFERFTPTTEATDIASGKKLLHTFAIQKRSAFFISFVSALCVIALSVFLIPPVYNLILAKPKNAMFTCAAFLLVSVIANIKMFADFKNLVNKHCDFDSFAALCSMFSLSLAFTAALTNSNAYYMILLCAIILFVRSLCVFKKISYMAGNLKQILNDKAKKAVTLIGDPATTFAMAKNKIEGDVLAAAPRNTVMVSDYMKHNEFAQKLSGKGPFLFFFTLTFSILCGILAYFYNQNNFFDAVYGATVITCLTSMPTLFFIDVLPMSSASKKLNARGAMIAGSYGAEKLELTNAAVVNTNDIFSSGSIKMYSMRVLSDNNIDDTILRAASLTAAINSPLENIFNQIAGTNSSYTIPDSDTVKYEKNLGISGWVNNELLFIGNRSFMQAHGIQIPSLEVDKKILRKGYFPVYVATTDTACALIVIQYVAKPEIAKELRKITDLGVTLLVENCDPNITEEMICDYFDLYEDSVKILSNSGVYMLKSATPDQKECSAPAAYRNSNINLVKIINCASMITRASKLLMIMYVLFAMLGVMCFVYAAFSGFMSMPQQTTVLLYTLATTFLSIIGFLIRKP